MAATTPADRDRSFIDVLKAATNPRQAAKIRDTRSTRSLYLAHECGREYWARGHPDGMYIYGRGHDGGTHLARLIDPGRLSGVIHGADHVDVVSKRHQLPSGILRMPGGERR